MKQEEKKLIDKYLQNVLTGSELSNFVSRMETDADFRREVSFHNLLMEGVMLSEELRLKTSIEKFIGYKRPLIPYAVKLIIAFLVITSGGIIFWSYTGTDSAKEKMHYGFLELFRNKKNNITISEGTNKSTVAKKLILKNKDASIDSLDLNEISSNAKNVNKNDSTEISTHESNDFVVKMDQLIISHIILPSHSNENPDAGKVAQSEARNTASKLNPAGGLPNEDEKSSEGYKVEFWASPINYKGYKLLNDKLILFGIEEPDAVELISSNDKLWMKYKNDFFILEHSDNFESFNRTLLTPYSRR